MSRTTTTTLAFGATPTSSGTQFRVWAPNARVVQVRLERGELENMPEESPDIFSTISPQIGPGERYFYTLDQGRPVPDPVSRLLPQGVHGPTEIVDPNAFRWSDAAWKGIARDEYIIYELHTGTFSPVGTFDGIIELLDYLKRLGVTVIEVMPVAATPGARNWGYDGASIYAVQANYGGPDGLKRLVNAAHQSGLAIMLDVVYNHLGPEGNYLRMFGPYFSDRHSTPWGEGINFDGPDSGPVRRYFVENALYWIREYHLDGLRLDAIQNIQDDSPQHIVAEINAEVQALAGELDRNVCVIAETDTNDPTIVRPSLAERSTFVAPNSSSASLVASGERNDEHSLYPTRGDGSGWGLCALWSDDFHHAVHTVLAGESKGYYQDFGAREQIVKALNEGFVYQGEIFKFWDGAPRGAKPEGVPLPAHAICIQNHDQIGNRAIGERLNHLVSKGAYKLASALLLLAPQTPLLFMGQEYGEQAPFQFFTDFGDKELQKAVSNGRRKEFEDFDWEDVPDPQDEQTYERSKLNWKLATEDNDVLQWYRQLLELRHRIVMKNQRTCRAELRDGNIVMQVPAENPKLMVVAAFPESKKVQVQGEWRRVMAAEEDGYAVAIYERASGTQR